MYGLDILDNPISLEGITFSSLIVLFKLLSKVFFEHLFQESMYCNIAKNSSISDITNFMASGSNNSDNASGSNNSGNASGSNNPESNVSKWDKAFLQSNIGKRVANNHYQPFDFKNAADAAVIAAQHHMNYLENTAITYRGQTQSLRVLQPLRLLNLNELKSQLWNSQLHVKSLYSQMNRYTTVRDQARGYGQNAKISPEYRNGCRWEAYRAEQTIKEIERTIFMEKRKQNDILYTIGFKYGC